MITLTEIKNNEAIKIYIEAANKVLGEIKFTEHGYAHATIASSVAERILVSLGYDRRMCELAGIAGYIHDIGNSINRHEHAQSGALLAYSLLSQMEMDPKEVATIVTAIGHHDEGTGDPVHPISAALIIADKSDVRRSRVREKADIALDIHDRVNFAVTGSELEVLPNEKTIRLSLSIDTKICAVMDYFEIFLSRMMLCRKAAEYLGTHFTLDINGTRLL
ncbi:MAG: HD domain-containing protein [Clostridiaceae bacterium]|nr:HD domain-containing protein [Clostridiaceae bacterium]